MQNTLRQMRDVSNIGTGPTNSPGTVWKRALDARTAQTVGSRLAPSRHSSAATAFRAFVRPGEKRLPRLLPAAVHNSQVASIIPSGDFIPVENDNEFSHQNDLADDRGESKQGEARLTFVLDLSRTLAAPTPILVPNSVPDSGRHELAVVRNATDNATGAELELNLFQKAKVGSEYDTH